MTAAVVHAPWHLRLQNPEGQEGRGFVPASFFDVFVDVNPPGGGTGWQTLSGTVQIPGSSEVQFVDCQSTSPTQFEAFCTPQPLTGPTQSIDFNVVSAAEITQAVTPFTMTFATPPTATTIVSDLMDVAAFNPYDPTLTPIAYDLSLLDIADVFPFAIKPTRQLAMQVYIVEGAATSTDVMSDVNVLEGSFNLNDEGYFDDGADTENVCYVPGIRGGALGTTYSPDGQIAVDNGSDHDNFTLFHEKIHELDLRHDGDFDVNDSPDDPDNDQGARDPHNGMNYDDMGPFLTPQQCEELVS